VVTRSNQRVTTRIYGGVQLSVGDTDVRRFTGSTGLSSLPKPEQASAREKLRLATSLEKILGDKLTGAEPLEVLAVKDKTASYQAVALPGTDTQALAPARLEETDLPVPVEGGHVLTLVRSYNSFFNPNGPWGKGWALNLPRLDEIKVPVQRDEKGVQFRTAFELTTPLNDLYVRFSRVEEVPALNSRLQVPDQPGAFYGLADAKPEFLSAPTRQLIRKDGGIWHFSQSGELVATEQDGFRIVYERDQSARLTRMAGLLGKRLVGSIEFRYDPNGRLESAKSSAGGRESRVRYEYDDAGRLAGVVSESGRLGYRYEGPWVTAVTYGQTGSNQEAQTLRRFEYNARGQLVAEVDAVGMRTEYRLTADSKGTAIAAVHADADSPQESIQYDRSMRPVKAQFADGTQTTWRYPAEGGVEVETADAAGRTMRLAESTDQRHRTLELDPNHKLAAEYTAAGQLASLAENGRTLLRQEWLANGKLRLASNELGAAHFGYDDDGLLSRVLLTPPGDANQPKQWQQTKLDTAGNPREITDYTGLEMSVGYDTDGRLNRIVRKQDGNNYGFEVTRDISGCVQEIKSSWGTQRYTYDDAGLPAKLELDEGKAEASAEWKDGLLQTLKQPDGGQYSLTYYPDGKQKGLPKQITAPNGLALNYQYDNANRLHGRHDLSPRLITMRKAEWLGGSTGLVVRSIDTSARMRSWAIRKGFNFADWVKAPMECRF